MFVSLLEKQKQNSRKRTVVEILLAFGSGLIGGLVGVLIGVILVGGR